MTAYDTGAQPIAHAFTDEEASPARGLLHGLCMSVVLWFGAAAAYWLI